MGRDFASHLPNALSSPECASLLLFPGVKRIAFLSRLAGSCSKDLSRGSITSQSLVGVHREWTFLTLVCWLMKGQRKKKMSLSKSSSDSSWKKRGLRFNYLLTFLWISQLKLNSGFFQAVVNLNQTASPWEGLNCVTSPNHTGVRVHRRSLTQALAPFEEFIESLFAFCDHW